MRSVTLFAAAGVLAFAGAAWPQGGFPSRAVTLTVGFTPGGGTDTSARIVAKKLSENIGQPVQVESKAGASGAIAAQHIANSTPDGYTIHMGGIAALAVAPGTNPNLPYDPRKDIAPITMGMVFPLVFLVQPTFPAKTLPEFVALAKRRPGELTYGTSGIGTTNHLAGALLAKQAGIDIVHVPYKGAGPATTDILGGRLSMLSAQLPNAKPQVDGGKLVALASTGARRSPLMPDVPTVAELGYPGFEVTTWYAFFASSKVPANILDYWNRELEKVLRDPVVAAELAKQGFEPAPGSRAELGRYLSAEIEKWGRIVRENKITLE